MRKSSITAVHPVGSTVHRRDGSEIRIGEGLTDGEALTVTLPHGAPGAAVSIIGPARPAIAERFAPPRVVAVDEPPPVEVDAARGLRVPTAASAVRSAPPAVKVSV